MSDEIQEELGDTSLSENLLKSDDTDLEANLPKTQRKSKKFGLTMFKKETTVKNETPKGQDPSL